MAWGGDEQLWDWKAWRSVELIKEESRGDVVLIHDGASWKGRAVAARVLCFAQLVGC